MISPDSTPDNAGKAGADQRRRNLWILAGVVLLGLLVYGLWWLLIGQERLEVDDAYVEGNLYAVDARTTGTVAAIPAYDTMRVEAGSTLVMLRGEHAGRKLQQAEAQLAQARQNALALVHEIQASRSKEAALRANLNSAQQKAWRLRASASAGASEDIAAITAADAVRRLQAEISAESAHSAALTAQLGSAGPAGNPAVRAATQALALAHLNWTRRIIRAPVTGIVAQQAVQPGQWVSAGQRLFTVVPLQQMWVTANIKETRLAGVRPGAAVTLHSDLYGNAVTYHGWVVGLGGGSGAVFAVLPPENASGNWIKFTQRVPVRIAVDPGDLARHPLRPGLTMTARIALHGPWIRRPVPDWFLRSAAASRPAP
ncbi:MULTISPECIES: HlyD family secretion protein [Acidithiobacillus]|jgi:membrane fusion protein (multidrug efflux system)|uniref:HlyD family efflux transporter periplasmic adaptor subunit n=5 Tax=Acidithiobacillus TaxID=119977 RepID=A0ACD5II57_9PROT|nr:MULTISPECIES: HlyD family efflux transporter periplasmic adaptor subunit [Acidithiobacillus]MBU2715067.1 HlyD family efflux transporter periplasmic adaptor subunit [Acidithiobacillus ferridurans]MBU2725885.1 HlyD family efflux transporter periplasmic adaptor subunit [Acidithiobacillus ferridurans]MBU2815336.1 HlyD family efflux transporter periplasmic adaptor subunit [Acidithiobacillus ferruginosus]BBF65166.1 putative multidrug resistance protein EmrK [Acidithiobacillus ferridurans]